VKRIACWSILFPAFLVTSPAVADEELAQATLKGLRAMNVVVESLKPEAERDGLLRDTIRTDVELKLRQAGIAVLSKSEPPAYAYLYVNVGTMKPSAASGLYAYCVHVELVQRVYLARDASVFTFARTWQSTGIFGTVGTFNLSSVRGTVRDSVDEFLNDYLAVNPKR